MPSQSKVKAKPVVVSEEPMAKKDTTAQSNSKAKKGQPVEAKKAVKRSAIELEKEGDGKKQKIEKDLPKKKAVVEDEVEDNDDPRFDLTPIC